MIFPSNNYPPIERPCAPFNDSDFAPPDDFTPSVLNPSDFLSYPTAQGTEVFQSVQIQQISDSTGNYGTSQQVLQGTVGGKIVWTPLQAGNASFQKDVYTSSQNPGLFDIVCPAHTTHIDIFAVSQGGYASVSGPKFVLLEDFGFDYFVSIFGPASGAAGSAVSLKSLPAQEGVCFRGQFQASGSYQNWDALIYSVINGENINLASCIQGNWSADPNIGDSDLYPGNGYVGAPRGSGAANIQNLNGNLLTVMPGNDGVSGIRWDWEAPMDGSYHPNPPYSQVPPTNPIVQDNDNFGNLYGSGGYFTDIYVNGNEPGYLHGTFNYPNDAAIIVVSYTDN